MREPMRAVLLEGTAMNGMAMRRIMMTVTVLIMRMVMTMMTIVLVMTTIMMMRMTLVTMKFSMLEKEKLGRVNEDG